MMKAYLPQLLLSVSLAALVYSAPSDTSKTVSTARNKRSFHTDQAHRQNSRHGHKPWPLAKLLAKSKRNGLDSLDFDSILNDPFFMDLEESSLEPSPADDLHNMPLEDLFMPEVKVKDEMSNVIPGAQGPFDPPPPRKEQMIADDLMDEFMTFLTMKEMGMLDMCLGFRRR